MSLVSFDGHSLMIDGHRTWLVSGSLHHARIPRGLWGDRLDAAQRAGLNCICVDAFWSAHEPQCGKFHFSDEADIAHFITLIRERGMACILRPGPFLGGGFDGGGIPAWLRSEASVALRSTSRDQPRFLEATGRYFAELMDQVRDLQATTPEGGPIILVQAEHEWFCDPSAASSGYLEELLRHLREHGCEVPVTMANNMWTRVDGTIDTWNASDHLVTDLRQISTVQPNAPRLVSEFTCAPPQAFGVAEAPMSPGACLAKLAEILSAGGQYNLAMFHGGTNFAFQGGINATGIGYTSAHAPESPLSQGGVAGPLLAPVKAISTFASQFGHILAHLDVGNFHAAVAPAGPSHVPSVIHQRGSRGDVVFIIRPASDHRTEIDLMLPNGLTLPVPMGRDTAAWVLLNANLGTLELNYTSLRPWAWIDQRILVLYGPAGATGHLSLNDAPMTVTVPTTQRPLVEQHEQVCIVVLNHAQMEAATLHDRGLIVGAEGVDSNGAAIPAPQWRTATRIAGDGGTSTLRFKASKPSAPPRLIHWGHAATSGFTEGTTEQYKPIPGPCSLDAAGTVAGYGWYRMTFANSWSGNTLPAGAADRVHFYRSGRLDQLWGAGPGADTAPFAFKATGCITALVDHLGRSDAGPMQAEMKGLFDHLFGIKAVRLGRTTSPGSATPDPFELGGYLHGIRAGDTADAGSYAWRIAPAGRLPLMVEIGPLPARAMFMVNGRPVGICLPGMPGGRFVLRADEHLRRRPNELRLAFFDEKPAAGVVTAAIRIYQATRNLTGHADWSFAPWQPPKAGAFGPLPAKFGGMPRWYRCQMSATPSGTPLWLDVSSLSKGQLFLNGRNLCRYFAQTQTRRTVDTRKRLYLPAPWLRTDIANELMIFDEHGFRPTGCRLYRTAG